MQFRKKSRYVSREVEKWKPFRYFVFKMIINSFFGIVITKFSVSCVRLFILKYLFKKKNAIQMHLYFS